MFRITFFYLTITAISSFADSDAPWLRHTIDDSSEGADGVRLTDINSDGLMDIATGWEEGGIVRYYLHPGYEKAHLPWPAVTVGKVASPEDAVFADLDADGTFEIISACEGKTRSIFVHRSNGGQWETEAFPATREKQSWMYSLPMQVDGKIGIDLIVGSKGTGATIGWLESPRDPSILSDWQYHRLQSAGWIMSLIAVDMDADGDEDVLVSDRKGKSRGVYWLEHPTDVALAQSWSRHDISSTDAEILFIDHGDLDHDGRLDVVASERTSLLWFRNTTTGWVEHVIPLPSGVGSGKSVAICDVDLNGKNDLVFSCENATGERSGMRWLSWQESPFSGKWIDHEIAGRLGIKFDRVVPYDADGDGDLDMLCCEEREGLGVFWYENPCGKNAP